MKWKCFLSDNKNGFGFAAGAPLLALLGAVLLAAGAAIFRRRDIL